MFVGDVYAARVFVVASMLSAGSPVAGSVIATNDCQVSAAYRSKVARSPPLSASPAGRAAARPGRAIASARHASTIAESRVLVLLAIALSLL